MATISLSNKVPAGTATKNLVPAQRPINNLFTDPGATDTAFWYGSWALGGNGLIISPTLAASTSSENFALNGNGSSAEYKAPVGEAIFISGTFAATGTATGSVGIVCRDSSGAVVTGGWLTGGSYSAGIHSINKIIPAGTVTIQPYLTSNGGASGGTATISDFSITPLTQGINPEFDENLNTTSGLTWGWKAGAIRTNVVVTQVAAGTLTLTASTTNYLEVSGTGGVSANTTAFSTGSIPLRTIVTGTTSITTSVDERAWFALSGTVTSISFTAPADFSVSGAPITASGTLVLSENTQLPNIVKAGPASGTVGLTPTYRALVAADIPSLSYATITQGATADSAVQSIVAGTDIVVDSTSPQAPIISSTGGITSAQASAIVTNTAKTGITSGQSSAITANTAKNTYPSTDASKVGYITVTGAVDLDAVKSDVAVNNSKVGITTIQSSAISTNSAKVGIITSQASAIVTNTGKVGITSSQVSAITANTLKVGISTSQASAISVNTSKVGITSIQAGAIVANTAKISYLDEDSSITTGLTWGWKAGFIRNGEAVISVVASTLALTASSTNYVEVNGTGVVSSNTTGFTSGSIPLRILVTGTSSITTSTDERTWIVTAASLAQGALADSAVQTVVAGTNAAVDSTNPQAPIISFTPGTLVITNLTVTSHTLALVDVGRDLCLNNSAAIALSIPLNATVAFPIGAWLLFSQAGAGVITASGVSGVTLLSPNGAATTAIGDLRGLEQVTIDTWRVI